MVDLPIALFILSFGLRKKALGGGNTAMREEDLLFHDAGCAVCRRPPPDEQAGMIDNKIYSTQ